MNYAMGGPSGDPDVILYDLCTAFGKLPSEIDEEDPAVMERLTYIHYIVQSRIAAEAARARR